ncbi:MAG: hypothetical protein NT157_02965 [Candidatus Micrarchaeota archaeon]|nr:hypothetical protein [Candidatus Micrarchaeota archaeon]
MLTLAGLFTLSSPLRMNPFSITIVSPGDADFATSTFSQKTTRSSLAPSETTSDIIVFFSPLRV